jgi:hypothetical protein
MLNNKRVVQNKSLLFVQKESEPHYIRVSPDSEEYLKVWVKNPTWLQVEQAMATVMKVDPKTQSMDIDLNGMYKYMIENFIEKTEPPLSAVDLIRLTPYVGAQLKEILPNPLEDFTSGDDEKNEQLEKP